MACSCSACSCRARGSLCYKRLQTHTSPFWARPRVPQSASVSWVYVIKWRVRLPQLYWAPSALKDADGLKERGCHGRCCQKCRAERTGIAKGNHPIYHHIVVLIILAVVIYRSSLPEVDTDQEDENRQPRATRVKPVSCSFRIFLGVLTLFFYVGVSYSGRYHYQLWQQPGYPLETAKFFTSCTLVCMLVGYIVGILCIPKYLSQEKAMKLSRRAGAHAYR
jgi:FHS family L-fucose permease-like MFS transporter